MKLSFERFESFGFNRIPLSEADFFEICDYYKIRVEERPVASSFYMTVLGKHVIVLNSRLRGLARRFAMFHELGHYFLHTGHPPETAFFVSGCKSKEETEADAFACICLIPWDLMDERDILEEHPQPVAQRIYNIRQQVAYLYNL